jgi:hypothetical protein
MTLPNNYPLQLQNIQKSPKFNNGSPLPFPGYTVTTPTMEEDPSNAPFYQYLSGCQQQLIEQLPEGLLNPVPPGSFHLTIADLLWDRVYLDALATKPDFENQLIGRIGESLDQYKSSAVEPKTIRLQMFGLSIFPRALTVCLVPNNDQGYKQIVDIRRSIYQNRGLIGLGVEQQYDFTGHLTLGYFGAISPELDLGNLAETLTQLNDSWLENEPPTLTINRVELRYFADMTAYNRKPDWPGIEF